MGMRAKWMGWRERTINELENRTTEINHLEGKQKINRKS